MVGIAVGTYSSVFVASPIVVLLEERAAAKQTGTA
jgi:preprotein translocase subunit SecF